MTLTVVMTVTIGMTMLVTLALTLTETVTMLVKMPCLKNDDMSGRVGVVVRALAFHQCGPGSISALGVKCGLSLLVLYSALRGFSPGAPVFPSHQKPTFDLICRKQL